jgi:hypothetical protein
MTVASIISIAFAEMESPERACDGFDFSTWASVAATETVSDYVT